MHQITKFFIYFIALCIPIGAVAQRQGAEYLVFELNFITKFIELNSKQKIGWDAAIATTKSMPDVTKGTYSAMKSSLKNSTSNADFDFFNAYSDLINGLYNVRNNTVEEHKKVAESWSKFDDELSGDQRIIFRSKISGILIDFFNRMSDGNEKSLRFPSLENDSISSQLNYNKDQSECVKKYSEEVSNISITAKINRVKYISKIQKIMIDPSAKFTLIAEEMESSYTEHRALVMRGGDALNVVSKCLTIDQRGKLNGIMLGKLKMLEKIIPNR